MKLISKMFHMFIRNSSGFSVTTKSPIPLFGVEGRYVSALFSAALQQNEVQSVEKSLRELKQELAKPTVVDFINTCMLSRVEKSDLLKKIGKEVGMPTTAVNFLGIVAENGRLKLLRRMISMYINVMVAYKNQAVCEVITADPLDDASRNMLLGTLKLFIKDGKKIKLLEKVNPEVLGGLVIGIEDKHIDLCIAKKVNVFTKALKISF